jgi:hypothetical protein
MKGSILITAIWLAAFGTASLAAPTVSNVAARITSVTNSGVAMKVRHFSVTFDLANTGAGTCRIWPAVRGDERNLVLAGEGPFLFWENLRGDTAATAGTGKNITFDITDTAGEFANVKVKVIAWDRAGWAPLPSRPFNPRHHHWNLDIRKGAVAANSASIMTSLQNVHVSWNCWWQFPIYQVMGNHQKFNVSCNHYCTETDIVPTPIPAISLGDPGDACVEGGTIPTPECQGGDCHMLIVDVENWIGWDYWTASRLSPLNYEGAGAQFFFTQKTYSTFGTNIGAYRCMDCTSADAAGLSILPGLVRLQDVADGEIQTALRFTTVATNGTYRDATTWTRANWQGHCYSCWDAGTNRIYYLVKELSDNTTITTSSVPDAWCLDNLKVNLGSKNAFHITVANTIYALAECPLIPGTDILWAMNPTGNGSFPIYEFSLDLGVVDVMGTGAFKMNVGTEDIDDNACAGMTGMGFGIWYPGAKSGVSPNPWDQVAWYPTWTLSTGSSIELNSASIAKGLSAFPNPFKPSTVLSVNAVQGGELKIFNLAGKVVKSFTLYTGHERITWNGTDRSGAPAASGIFIARMESGKQSFTTRLFLAK